MQKKQPIEPIQPMEHLLSCPDYAKTFKHDCDTTRSIKNATPDVAKHPGAGVECRPNQIPLPAPRRLPLVPRPSTLASPIAHRCSPEPISNALKQFSPNMTSRPFPAHSALPTPHSELVTPPSPAVARPSAPPANQTKSNQIKPNQGEKINSPAGLRRTGAPPVTRTGKPDHSCPHAPGAPVRGGSGGASASCLLPSALLKSTLR
jgi:hypothetical protein